MSGERVHTAHILLLLLFPPRLRLFLALSHLLHFPCALLPLILPRLNILPLPLTLTFTLSLTLSLLRLLYHLSLTLRQTLNITFPLPLTILVFHLFTFLLLLLLLLSPLLLLPLSHQQARVCPAQFQRSHQLVVRRLVLRL